MRTVSRVVQRSCQSELGHFVRLASKWRSNGLLFERRAWDLLRSCRPDVLRVMARRSHSGCAKAKPIDKWAVSPPKNGSRRESDTGFQEINNESWGTASSVMTKQKGMNAWGSNAYTGAR